MTDGQVHLTYELVLTNVAPAPVRVDRIEMHDAATSAVPGTTGRVDLTPLLVGTEAEGVGDPGAGNTSVTIAPTTTYIAWVDIALPQRSAVPATIEHVVSGAVLAPGAPPAPVQMGLGRTDPATDGPTVVGAPVPAGYLGLTSISYSSPIDSRQAQSSLSRGAGSRVSRLDAARSPALTAGWLAAIDEADAVGVLAGAVRDPLGARPTVGSLGLRRTSRDGMRVRGDAARVAGRLAIRPR